MEDKKSLIEVYINAWKTADPATLADCLTQDCVIIESDNSSYRGMEAVKNWIQSWTQKGNKVNVWQIELYFEDGEAAFFEWHFEAFVGGKQHSLDGASFVKFIYDKISYIREYRTVRREVEVA